MSKTTILIVEDELLIALSLRKVLEGAGYVCISPAVNYETAVALAFERRPDIILMDIKLRGEKTGIDAARTILSRTPVGIIFVTGNASLVEEYPADEISYHEVLYKPVPAKRLLDSIVRFLDSTRKK